MTTLPRNVDDLFALSPMQHLMLLHAIAEEGNGVLLNQVVYDVRGALDTAALRLAWQQLIARHAALRTAFLWEGLPQPVQVVRTTVPLPWREVDLASLTTEARAEALHALLREEALAALPLGKAPLMRGTLVRLTDDHHQFVWAIHHLVIDRWSHAILLDELRALYGAAAARTAPALPPAAPFRAYVAWLERQDGTEVERYWRDALAGFTVPTPLRRGAAPVRGASRVTTYRALSPAGTRSVQERAAHWRITPGALLQFAVGLWLAARSDRDDVIFGLTVSGRPAELAEAASIVGSLVSNVPVRLQLARDRSLAEALQELHRGEGRRQRFVHASPAQLHAWSELPAGRALFDTLLLLNLTEAPGAAWPNLEWAPRSATLDAGYPYLVAVGSDAHGLGVTLVHDAAEPDAAELLEELTTIIERVASAPVDATVGAVLATARESVRVAPQATRSAAEDAPPVVPRAPRVSADAIDEPLASALLRAWREVLGVADLGLDDDFFAAGGTSLQAAQLFVQVERITGRTLPLSTLFGASSVRALLTTLGRPQPRRGALVEIRSSGHRAPIYAVPGIGGNVVNLFGVARHLGSAQPFGAFESPGLDGREAPLVSIEAIAQRYVDDLVPALPTGDFHLLGICWGAAVAFEMATRLAAMGRAPTSVALLDPAVLLREQPARQASADVSFVRTRLELYWDEFREGNWRDRSRLVADKARRAARALTGGDGGEQSRAELHQSRVRDANTAAVTRYSPQPGAMHARLFLTADRELTAANDPRLEWRSLIAPTPSIVEVAGRNSGDAIAPAHVAGFTRALQEWISAAAAGEHGAHAGTHDGGPPG
jgi:thioesterase domain-containing protein